MRKEKSSAKKEGVSTVDKLNICPGTAPKGQDKNRVTPLKPMPAPWKWWTTEMMCQKLEPKHQCPLKKPRSIMYNLDQT